MAVVIGTLSVRGFSPQTAKSGGGGTTKRKTELRDAFVSQNRDLGELRDRCRDRRLSLDATFYLNKNAQNPTGYKKDLDNLLKILMDVVKEEMDDSTKERGLGLVAKNGDEQIFRIVCCKELVSTDDDEGIDLAVSEWAGIR